MDPIKLTGPTQRDGLPRVSGDGPYSVNRTCARQVAAPRERGWTPEVIDFCRALIGCPA